MNRLYPTKRQPHMYHKNDNKCTKIEGTPKKKSVNKKEWILNFWFVIQHVFCEYVWLERVLQGTMMPMILRVMLLVEGGGGAGNIGLKVRWWFWWGRDGAVLEERSLDSQVSKMSLSWSFPTLFSSMVRHSDACGWSFLHLYVAEPWLFGWLRVNLGTGRRKASVLQTIERDAFLAILFYILKDRTKLLPNLTGSNVTRATK